MSLGPLRGHATRALPALQCAALPHPELHAAVVSKQVWYLISGCYLHLAAQNFSSFSCWQKP